jgi:Transglycosylase SLT domain
MRAPFGRRGGRRRTRLFPGERGTKTMSVDTSNATAPAGVDAARARVTGAIKQAANATGTSFEYLLATAKMESDFNPTAGASTSSAHGLYQFIDQTWLATVKEAGGDAGYGQYADSITKSASGDYVVSDPAARRAIMKLRDDPAASSSMAALLTQSNSFQLTGKIGRRPTDGELYMAHFLGVGGAAKLITSAEDTPQASAVKMFPGAAAANRSIFYDRQGQPRSVSDVYSVISSRYAGAANSQATQTALAVYGASPPASQQVASNPVPTPALQVDSATYLSTFPNVAGPAAVAPVTMASASGNDAQQQKQEAPVVPAFRSLFQVDDSHPVSATVHQLWGRSTSLTSVPNTDGSGPSNGGAAQPLDLFSDRNGTFSS